MGARGAIGNEGTIGVDGGGESLVEDEGTS
jgi:hypothetical protein